ncbi:MAG: cadmium-translocating P-type ATPase [Proteobacteria bacterium]|nr:cadmium-translocating P-type ATPase [Pseudomonadota bacterium]
MLIAILAAVALAAAVVMEFVLHLPHPRYHIPLYVALLFGGVPLVWELVRKALRLEFGSDLLAAISIVVGCLLGEYMAATLVVLMLSGGTALERMAVGRASSVLDALAKRMPHVAHLARDGSVQDVPLSEVKIGQELVVFPHETCPIDGVVVQGNGVMDEAYLTGEPFKISKGKGSEVFSGAINGDQALRIRATRAAVDSRYARIMQVMRETEHQRVRLRRLGDSLGAWYTPLAVGIALLAWWISGDVLRFLSVLVVATPCPLLIAIPVAIIGSISLAAKRGIIIRDPAVLEAIDLCETIILDKTGTLTFGAPTLKEELYYGIFSEEEVFPLIVNIERYSKHPLAKAFLDAANTRMVPPIEVEEISEPPGQGLTALVRGKKVLVTSRKYLSTLKGGAEAAKLPQAAGLECVVLIDGELAALYRFRDEPRPESHSFVKHLGPKHRVKKTMLVSGDRESEVRYLADLVGISDVHASVSPEGKVEIVRRENSKGRTLFLGDGINDAPALAAATVGVAFGSANDITSEAADAVIMEPSLAKVDEFFHIAKRMRSIALQSAVGGMACSIVGMLFAAGGLLTPVAGALLQELIDLCAVLNALRVARQPKRLSDF